MLILIDSLLLRQYALLLRQDSLLLRQDALLLRQDALLLRLKVCCILSFGWITGAWMLYADVSERSGPSSQAV
jgi:hypothetical protein